MVKVYGVPGWGSAISEVMLTLADIPYSFIDVDGFDCDGPARELPKTVNPLCQVSTLVLENGGMLTETAVIVLMILDRRPELSLPVGYAERQQFQRLLIWLVANVYPTFTYADYPDRRAPDAPAQLKKNCIEYRESLYMWLNNQLSAEPYAFGDQLTLLDTYIAAMRTWGLGHERFQDNTPNISAIADAVCQHPRLCIVLRSNKIIWIKKRCSAGVQIPEQ